MIHHINKRKDENHTIISIGAKNTLDKILHSFMITSPIKAGIEGICLNIIKGI